MKKFNYLADTGSLLVGIPSTSCDHDFEFIQIINDYGDGCFDCFVMDYSEFLEHQISYYNPESDYKLVLSIFFDNAVVFDYDCLDQYLSPCGEPLIKLSGTYQVYVNSGNVYFVKFNVLI